MKPFNLEKALNGHPVVTRCGIEVINLHYFKESSSIYKLHGVVKAKYNSSVKNWTDEGVFNKDEPCSLDLFLKTEKKTVYVNIYKRHPDGKLEAVVHEDSENAECCAVLVNCVAVAVPVTFEE